MGVAERRHRFRKPWTLADAKAAFAERGCLLLEQEYTGSRQVMRYICAGGHEYKQRFSHFLAGHGCLHCRNNRRWFERRIDLDEILVAVENEGVTDVSVCRRDGRIRIQYTCVAGHRTDTSRSSFLEGKRCRKCVGIRQRGAGSVRFNHGLTSAQRLEQRKYHEYREWRRLNAHHIVNFIQAPGLRTDLANGITLCAGCHRGFHRFFGYQNNTAAQLQEFMGVE